MNYIKNLFLPLFRLVLPVINSYNSGVYFLHKPAAGQIQCRVSVIQIIV